MRIVTTILKEGFFSATATTIDADVQVSGPFSVVIGTIKATTVDIFGQITIKTTRFYQDSLFGIPGRTESSEDVVHTTVEELMLAVELEIALATMELLVALDDVMSVDTQPGFARGYGDYDVEDIWPDHSASGDSGHPGLFNCTACNVADCGIRRQPFAGSSEPSLRAS